MKVNSLAPTTGGEISFGQNNIRAQNINCNAIDVGQTVVQRMDATVTSTPSIVTSDGDLTITPAGSNVTVAAGKTLKTNTISPIGDTITIGPNVAAYSLLSTDVSSTNITADQLGVWNHFKQHIF